MYSPIPRKNRDETVIYKVIHMTASKLAHRKRYLLPDDKMLCSRNRNFSEYQHRSNKGDFDFVVFSLLTARK